ncbi:hypothetical protein SEA_PATIO_18 [Gordonia phage Patio]|uniref:Uncharacterized protein n=3 Tax=Skysandvirus TaxID=2948912 RepID=A0A2D2W4I2_9CAUD|nr:hypothetical protein KNT76_gp18 [Gordonia phage Patio]YP_010098085.1 hypothetical protein KNU08_gp17 [Gordonia phage Skysand]YP_010103127.1 hypothetical protein KNU64_gp20 [Gordonia Phage Lollipop1437]QRI45257.1 hypothetical protein SEA_ENNEA_21 [Gordonia phage Ennea]QXN74400.1 hypothetical protein SEA_FLOAT294_17 [Gordonia phage Float294]ATS93100.1 hypothetical protein SEA_PATIO_18 [Gordonia phage Patio]AXQ62051.1 hypothetical protein SEA_SKYSAND_17 [Gordonia phage Skysand]QDF19124.1 hyp
MSHEQLVGELKVTKRIDPDRVGRVLKQNYDTVHSMTNDQVSNLIRQAEADMKRCYDASETLREVGGQLGGIMEMALAEALKRNIRIQ